MSLKTGTYSLNGNSGSMNIYTFKEGLLSAIAHDLLIEVQKFKVDVDIPEEGGLCSGKLDVELQANSLKVVCAMKAGERNPGALKDKDIADIEKDIFKKVLHPDKYPTVNFSSSEINEKEGGYSIKGDLNLHGVSKPVEFDIDSSDEESIKGRFAILQKDHGIKPFKAMMGTLRIKNEINLGFDLKLVE